MIYIISSQHEGRQYCEHDFKTLYAPCCSGCGKYTHDNDNHVIIM